MIIDIIDELETDESRTCGEFLEGVIKGAVSFQGKGDDFELSLTLTDDETIQSINLEQRGINSSTDVLSFPMQNEGEEFRNPDTGNIVLGDIVISLPHAKEQAEEYGHSIRRETAYLCVHGILHLFGFDHMNEEEKAVMREREEEVLACLKLTRGD